MTKEDGRADNSSTSNHTRQLSDGEDPVAAIVESVAAASGRPVLDLDPLADTVDPDAVNTVLEAKDSLHLSFDYQGYRVTVNSQEVSVEDCA